MYGFILDGCAGNMVGDASTISGIGKQVILYVHYVHGDYLKKLFDYDGYEEIAIGIVEDEECRTANLIGRW